jgi:acyl-CoA reductase-like NAD-dependent aldehyde dehydrogenase
LAPGIYRRELSKQSGFGREGGFEGISEYLETKYVAMSV